MTIENLIKAVPPPASPTYAFEGPWEPIETNLNTALPQDYKDLVRVYGDGTFLEWFGVYGPISPGPGGRLIPEVYHARSFFVEYTKHWMYPRPGGLLACGSADDGNYFLWLTRGASPEEWPIVVWHRHALLDNDLVPFECDLTDFIVGVVTGDILYPGAKHPSDYLIGQPLFTPTPDPWPDDLADT